MEIIAKDPINLIKEKVSFKFNENVIKLNDGDEMAKMIVGNALKNNLEFIENEKKEIEFSIKYQILSKNTAIFTEILNNKEKKLINPKRDTMTKVNLNQYKEKTSCNKKKKKKQKVVTDDEKFAQFFGGNNQYIFSFSSPVGEEKHDFFGDYNFNFKRKRFNREIEPDLESWFGIGNELIENDAPKGEKKENNNIIKNSGNILFIDFNILLYYYLLLIFLL